MFFLVKHQHNEYCQSLPWPSYSEIYEIKDALEGFLMLEKSTTYTTYGSKYDKYKKIEDLYFEVINSTFKHNTNDNSDKLILLLAFAVIIFVIITRKENDKPKLNDNKDEELQEV